jgi:hypothetical protein
MVPGIGTLPMLAIVTMQMADEGMSRSFALAVEVATETTGEAVPRRFSLGGRTVEVAEVLDRWPGADHTYFKLRGADDAVYILRCDEGTGAWQLVQFIRSDQGGH